MFLTGSNPASARTWSVAWIGILILWNVAFVFPLFGPIIHESDQASLLEGAVAISRTGKLADRGFYNYDKQYGAYWIVAAGLNLLESKPSPSDVVGLGNAISVVFLNAGLVLLAFSAGSPTTFVLLGCLLLSPSFLVHAPFLAGNYLSAFFLFAQFIVLSRSGPSWAALVCAFCATACRADALLVQPILLWCATSADTCAHWLRDKRLWGCAAAALIALLLGKSVTSADANSFGPFALFLDCRILSIYSLFGLGAGIGIFLLCVVALSQGIGKPGAFWFALTGLLSIALPFAYYIPNLYSTRHWTAPLVALMCFVASSHGQGLVRATLGTSRLRTGILVVLILSAGLPVFIGFRFTASGVPHLTISRPALVPSADGLVPLGSYLSHSWGWNRDRRQIPDHNQATWLAALAADFGSPKTFCVQLLASPLVSILQLAASSRGLDYQVTEAPNFLKGVAYTEFRALRKAPMSPSQGKLDELVANATALCGVEFASPCVAGEAIVKLTSTKNELAEELHVLREAFGGIDYHVLRLNPNGALPLGDAEAGHLMALFSRSPFKLNRGTKILTPERNRQGDGEDYYLLKFLVEDVRPTFILEGGETVLALSVLPAFLNPKVY